MFCNLHRSFPGNTKGEYFPHHSGGLRVNLPVVFIPLVPIGNLCAEPLSAVALVGEHSPYLLGRITGIELIEPLPNRYQIVKAFVAVDAVSHGDIADAVILCESLHQCPHYKPVTTQPGMVLDNHGRNAALLNQFHHLLKTGAVKVRPRVAIIREEADVWKTVVLAIGPQEIPLILNTDAVSLLLVLLGEPVITSSDFGAVCGECAGDKGICKLVKLPHKNYNLLR